MGVFGVLDIPLSHMHILVIENVGAKTFAMSQSKLNDTSDFPSLKLQLNSQINRCLPQLPYSQSIGGHIWVCNNFHIFVPKQAISTTPFQN